MCLTYPIMYLTLNIIKYYFVNHPGHQPKQQIIKKKKDSIILHLVIEKIRNKKITCIYLPKNINQINRQHNQLTFD